MKPAGPGLVAGMMMLALEALADGPPQQPAPGAAGDRWKLSAELSLGREGNDWVFRLRGRTDLQARTVLRARIYVVGVLEDPLRGAAPDDGEPLVREAAGPPPYRSFEAGSGVFDVDVHSFERRPYSIRYRAKIEYRPEAQTDAVRLGVGDLPFTRSADLRLGTDAEFEAELRVGVREISEDLLALESLAGELGRQALGSGAPAGGWAEWRAGARARLARLLERNGKRFSLWAVWPESQGRMHVAALGEYLDRTIESVEPGQEEGRVRDRLEGFIRELDRAYTAIGIEAPLDAARAAPAFLGYERAVAPLLGGVRTPEAGRHAVQALVEFLPLLRGRLLLYPYLNELGASLSGILELPGGEPSGEALRECVRRHEAALGAFRRAAGIAPGSPPRAPSPSRPKRE